MLGGDTKILYTLTIMFNNDTTLTLTCDLNRPVKICKFIQNDYKKILTENSVLCFSFYKPSNYITSN